MGATLAAWLAVTPAWPVWLVAIGGVAGGGLVFAAAAYGLGCPEARLFPTLVRDRFGRRQPQALPPA